MLVERPQQGTHRTPRQRGKLVQKAQGKGVTSKGLVPVAVVSQMLGMNSQPRFTAWGQGLGGAWGWFSPFPGPHYRDGHRQQPPRAACLPPPRLTLTAGSGQPQNWRHACDAAGGGAAGCLRANHTTRRGNALSHCQKL